MAHIRTARKAGRALLRLLAIAVGTGLPGISPWSESRAAPATMKLNVVARISSFFRMRVDHQQAALTITPRDVELGYVDAHAASAFTVTTNTEDAYAIDFVPRSDVFRSVVVTGLPNTFEAGIQGGTAALEQIHGRVISHRLSYRFVLRRGLQPGSYPWPLQIAVHQA
jgi:hypothetical protein